MSDTANSKMTFVVVDDHEAILSGTVAAIQQQYPDAQIITAKNQAMAWDQIASVDPAVVIMDLSIPAKPEGPSQTENGLQLLRSLLEKYERLNIVVQSAHSKTLIRLKPAIDAHQGGFTVSDKSASIEEMMKKVDWAMQGVMFTPREMRNGLEIKPEWLEVIELAFNEGMQDKAIAEKMCVAERTVRHYWTKVQDALEVYPEEGKNIRIMTQIRARQEGLLD